MLCHAHPREVAALDGATDIDDDLIGSDRGQRIRVATSPFLQLPRRIRRIELGNRHEPHASTIRDTAAMTRDFWTVASREDLVDFVSGLRDEHRAEPSGWENNDLDRFLDALAAWIAASPGYWANRGESEPEQPDWGWVALALRAGTGYE
jgi:hypothetical protein